MTIINLVDPLRTFLFTETGPEKQTSEAAENNNLLGKSLVTGHSGTSCSQL